MHEDDAMQATAGFRRPLRARSAVVSCLVVGLSIAVVMQWSSRRDDASVVGTMPSAANAAASTPAGGTEADPFVAPVDAPGHRATDSPRAQAVARLRREFEASSDLFDYAQRLVPAVRSGDAEATWLMSRVADYCAGYANDPAGFARDTRLLAGMDLPAAPAMTEARDRLGARCRRFSASDGLSPSFVRQLRLSAAQAGSLVAEAELLAMDRPLATDDAYERGLVDRIGRSGDADAFGALANEAGAFDWLASIEPDIAPQYRSLVLQLAACRLGKECGPGSTLMTSYCVNGGICSRNPEQGFEEFVYDAAIPRQSAEMVRSAVAALVDRFGGQR